MPPSESDPIITGIIAILFSLCLFGIPVITCVGIFVLLIVCLMRRRRENFPQRLTNVTVVTTAV